MDYKKKFINPQCGGDKNMNQLQLKYMNIYIIQKYMNLDYNQMKNIHFLEQVQMVLMN